MTITPTWIDPRFNYSGPWFCPTCNRQTTFTTTTTVPYQPKHRKPGPAR